MNNLSRAARPLFQPTESSIYSRALALFGSYAVHGINAPDVQPSIPERPPHRSRSVVSPQLAERSVQPVTPQPRIRHLDTATSFTQETESSTHTEPVASHDNSQPQPRENRERNQLMSALRNVRSSSGTSVTLALEACDAIRQLRAVPRGEEITQNIHETVNNIIERHAAERAAPPVNSSFLTPSGLGVNTLSRHRFEDHMFGGIARHAMRTARESIDQKEVLKCQLGVYGLSEKEQDAVEMALSEACLEPNDYSSFTLYLEKVQGLEGAAKTIKTAFQQMVEDKTMVRDVLSMIEGSLGHCIDSKAEVLTRIQVRTSLASLYSLDRSHPDFMSNCLEQLKRLHHDAIFDEVFNSMTYFDENSGCQEKKLIDNGESTEIRGRYKLIMEKAFDFSSKMPTQRFGGLGLTDRKDVLNNFKSCFQRDAKDKKHFINYVTNLIQSDEKLMALLFPKTDDSENREEAINNQAYELLEAIDAASSELGSQEYNDAMKKIMEHRDKLLDESKTQENKALAVKERLSKDIEKHWMGLLDKTAKPAAPQQPLFGAPPEIGASLVDTDEPSIVDIRRRARRAARLLRMQAASS